MKSKKRVLFLTEKWCDGNPNMGPTNHEHNLFGTLASLNTVEIGVFHFDEYKYQSGNHIDVEVPKLIVAFKPDVVVVSHLGTSPMNPTIKSYDCIRESGSELVFVWPDTRDEVIDKIKELKDIASLHVSWAFELEDPIVENHVWLATPQDPRLYHKQDEKSYGATFVGSLDGYTHRRPYLHYAQSVSCDLVNTGGQREAKLTAEQYAYVIRASKISVNFSESAVKGRHQMKGRVNEALSCGTLLLEYKNDVTSKYLLPGIHYVEFSAKEDLVAKVNYYLENEVEREKIAAAGLAHYNSNFSPACFWGTIFTRIGVEV
tara:strand:- start:198 stop:1148 length:951 start_codon:yes stop_codon:yes gene_type:complete